MEVPRVVAEIVAKEWQNEIALALAMKDEVLRVRVGDTEIHGNTLLAPIHVQLNMPCEHVVTSVTLVSYKEFDDGGECGDSSE